MAVRRIRNGNGLTFGSKELPDRHTVGPVNERRLKAAQGENKLMKLMKHIMIALVLCAIPAVAFGQNVVCDDCDHVVPYYKGNGGFVGMMTAGAEKVTFVAECDNVTTTGTADVNADGLASMLFNDMNGLACDDMDGGSMQVAGLEDGAWYWITDDMNSAVGSLVNKAVLDNDMTMPADPGSDDIVMTPGQGAYFLKQLSTGRVGILSTIMAEPPTPPATMCGAYRAPNLSVQQTTTNCMLGDGSAWIRLQGPNRRGARADITAGGTVERNISGAVDVLVDLWTMGGTVSETGTAAGVGYERLGASLSVSAFSVALAGGAPNQDAGGAGVTVGTTDDVGTITITDGGTEGYCTTTESHSVTITITAASDQTGLLPAVRALNAEGTVHGMADLVINCPSAAANAGQELVPDNPFPTDK